MRKYDNLLTIRGLLLLIAFLAIGGGKIFAHVLATFQAHRQPQYTCVDIHKYEHTMWLTCELFEGDRRVEDFEIAVLDSQGECRGEALSGGDKNFPHIAYVTIHGTANADRDLQVRVVYGDEEDPYRYDLRVEGLTFDMISDEAYGHTLEPFRITVPGKAAFSWAVGDGDLHHGVAAELRTELLEGATRLAVSGHWTAQQQELLRSCLPRASLEALHLSSEWAKTDLRPLLDGCQRLTALRLNAVPEMAAPDLLAKVNPNCLIYLPKITTTAPEGWTNVVVENDSNYLALSDIYLEGSTSDRLCPFALDKDILLNGHQAIFIPQTLNFVDNASRWNTVVLPFTADVYADGTRLTGNFDEYAAPDSYWLMRYRRVSGTSLVLTYVETGLAAHTPYLLALPGEALGPDCSLAHRRISFRSQGDRVKAVPAKIQDPFFENRVQDVELLGNYAVTADAPRYLLLPQGEGGDAFVFQPAARVLPFQCYLQCREGAEMPGETLHIGDRYLPTGVENFPMAEGDSRVVYDLSGRQVVRDRRLSPGCYIMGGTKRWVRAR